MTNKISYLFGAGASAQALPTVEKIPQRINKLIGDLNNPELKLSSAEKFSDLRGGPFGNKSKYDFQKEMIDSLSWMLEESDRHASIDTFAKKLYIKESDAELKKLKITMSVFFILEQLRTRPDKRYDAFFASIVDQRFLLPNWIKIMTWNYDYQFELAFMEYTDNYDLEFNQNMLNISSKGTKKNIPDGFGIYKLNGTTGLGDRMMREYFYIRDWVDELSILMEDIVKSFAVAFYKADAISKLSFAWEEDPSTNYINKVSKEFLDTEVLVVIGYSFPFFNREVDRKIIGSMSNLRKVYFQAPDADVLKERFLSIRDDIRDIELETVKDVGQFLLPKEL